MSNRNFVLAKKGTIPPGLAAYLAKKRGMKANPGQAAHVMPVVPTMSTVPVVKKIGNVKMTVHQEVP